MSTNQKNGCRASTMESLSQEMDGFEVFSGDLERLSTKDLVFFLETSFRKAEYEKVAMILSSREQSLKAEIERMRACGDGVLDALYKSLDAQVEAAGKKCLELEEKFKEGEVGIRRRVTELEQKFWEEKDRSEVEKLLASEALRKSKRTCARLEAQLTRIKEDLGVMQRREQRALERIDALSAELKKKEEIKEDLGVMQRREQRALERIDALSEESAALEAANRSLECTKRRAEDERDEWKKKFGELQVRALRLVEENSGIMEGQKWAEKEKREKQSEENRSQWNVEDSGSLARRCSTKHRVGSARKEAPFMQIMAKAPSERFIVIADSKDSDEEMRTTSNTLTKSAEKMDFDGRKVEALDYENRQCQENYLRSSSSKRRPASKMLAQKDDDKDDNDGNDEDDDRFPIGKLKRKRLEGEKEGSEMPDDSFMNLSSCYEKSGGNLATLRNSSCSIQQSNGTNGKQKETPTTKLKNKGLLLYDAGFPDSTEREVADLASNGDFAKNHCKRETMNWDCEEDMLSSILEDFKLCLEAVCTIYRQSVKESVKEKRHPNRGFSTFDAYKGTKMAEFLLDGDPHGPSKKSVEELKKHDPQGLHYCCKLAAYYSEQLFEIYKNKEDSYFLPHL